MSIYLTLKGLFTREHNSTPSSSCHTLPLTNPTVNKADRIRPPSPHPIVRDPSNLPRFQAMTPGLLYSLCLCEQSLLADAPCLAQTTGIPVNSFDPCTSFRGERFGLALLSIFENIIKQIQHGINICLFDTFWTCGNCARARIYVAAVCGNSRVCTFKRNYQNMDGQHYLMFPMFYPPKMFVSTMVKTLSGESKWCPERTQFSETAST